MSSVFFLWIATLTLFLECRCISGCKVFSVTPPMFSPMAFTVHEPLFFQLCYVATFPAIFNHAHLFLSCTGIVFHRGLKMRLRINPSSRILCSHAYA
ncbi:hypothetical protein B0H12DRAFT_689207 [Mycena haematopus]|nr:hypothetical protein B0H12DRAFT_689207 [Mycena haematopus]